MTNNNLKTKQKLFVTIAKFLGRTKPEITSVDTLVEYILTAKDNNKRHLWEAEH